MHQRNSSIAPFLSALPVEMQRNEEIAAAMLGERSDVFSMINSAVDRGVKTGEIAASRAPGAAAMLVAGTMCFSMYASLIAAECVSAEVDAYMSLIDGTLLGPSRGGHDDRKRKRGDAAAPRALVRGVHGVIRLNSKK
jgi:hypothetical protein